MAWKTAQNFIYYGAQNLPDDIEIPGAPGQHYNWDGSAWVHDAVAEQQAKASALEADLTQYIDDVARQHTWQDIGRAIAAASRPGAFQANATALSDWWDACWVKAHEIKAAAVASGTIPDKAAFLAQMPPAPAMEV